MEDQVAGLTGIYGADISQSNLTKILSEKLQLSILSEKEIASLLKEGNAAGKSLLCLDASGLDIRELPRYKRSGRRIEFPILHSKGRGQNSRALSRSQPLAKAIGKFGQDLEPNAYVLDATAGFGQDSWRIACWGKAVVACERNPIIAELLAQALQEVKECLQETEQLSKLPKIEFVCANAIELIPSLEQAPEVIYIDPMFPPKRKSSALPKKEIQLLRSIVGDDKDAVQLLEVSLQYAKSRVVVKRPPYASPLLDGALTQQSGKLIRYDVYSTK